MFRFTTPQRIVKLGNLQIGGQPGELPTVLIGSIFYQGHKLLKDGKKGTFDKVEAETLIKNQEVLSDATGNPAVLDVVISSTEAIDRELDFISTVTDAPFLFDAWPPSVRLTGLEYLKQTGLNKRTIYNSLSPATREGELTALMESKVKTAILLTYNFKDPWVKGLLPVLRETETKPGLLSVAEEAGVENPLVDTCVTSVPSIGVSARAIHSVKAEFGVPSGCGAANATTRWKLPQQKWGDAVYKACEASAQTSTIAMGADFLMYGPIESSPWIFPASAALDAIVATATSELGTRTCTQDHPLTKLFPEISEKTTSKTK
ncbi:MAG: tetrahydromethanopterin S-methyltransferase subunit H [Candidatus Bathyarchaeota archaeon]|nr:MAG: tetrahydromethanopterin S-methyltransferase subunit H [Candidatus Bathyarchaeota archaeon]